MKIALCLLFLSLLSCKKDVSLKEYFNYIDDSWIETVSTQGGEGQVFDDFAQVKVQRINQNEIHLVSNGERETITMKLKITDEKVELKETIIDSQEVDTKTTFDPAYVLISQDMLSSGSGTKSISFTTHTEVNHVFNGVKKSSEDLKLNMKWVFHKEYQGYKSVFVVNTENKAMNYTEESIYMKGRGIISYTYQTPNFKLTKMNGKNLKK